MFKLSESISDAKKRLQDTSVRCKVRGQSVSILYANHSLSFTSIMIVWVQLMADNGELSEFKTKS